jgi:hypothetical protein
MAPPFNIAGQASLRSKRSGHRASANQVADPPADFANQCFTPFERCHRNVNRDPDSHPDAKPACPACGALLPEVCEFCPVCAFQQALGTQTYSDSNRSSELRFEHYTVLQDSEGKPFELGRGAMGVTYKAFDVHLQRPAALKIINMPSRQLKH